MRERVWQEGVVELGKAVGEGGKTKSYTVYTLPSSCTTYFHVLWVNVLREALEVDGREGGRRFEILKAYLYAGHNNFTLGSTVR